MADGTLAGTGRADKLDQGLSLFLNPAWSGVTTSRLQPRNRQQCVRWLAGLAHQPRGSGLPGVSRSQAVDTARQTLDRCRRMEDRVSHDDHQVPAAPAGTYLLAYLPPFTSDGLTEDVTITPPRRPSTSFYQIPNEIRWCSKSSCT